MPSALSYLAHLGRTQADLVSTIFVSLYHSPNGRHHHCKGGRHRGSCANGDRHMAWASSSRQLAPILTGPNIVVDGQTVQALAGVHGAGRVLQFLREI